MRMVWEAKHQLCTLLVNAGFPEECVAPCVVNNQGPDTKLDVLISLLTYGY
jgi:ATP-dependent RNA helicase A